MRRLLAAALSALIVLSVPVLIASISQAKEQRFSVMCKPSDRSFRDPSLAAQGERIDISDHLHQFFGNKSEAVRRLNLRKMRHAGTECELSGDTASYWLPAELELADGDVVYPTQVLVYYRHKGPSDVEPHAPGTQLKSFDVSWGCFDSDDFAAPRDCANREVRLRVVFRPEDNVPRIAMNVRFDTQDGAGAVLHSGPAGPHGNFWNTWKQREYRRLVNTCLEESSVAAMSESEWDAACVKVSD